MELALIPPLQNIGATRWTKYQMLLPHLLSDEHYVRAYQRRRAAGNYLIMDNGAAEPEGRIRNAELIHHAKGMMVNEIVMPDVLGDAAGTLEAIKAFAEEGMPLSFNYMAVVQGESYAELIDCAEALINLSWVTCLGIPRHILSLDEDTRWRVVRYLRTQSHWRKDIHLLGMHPEYPFEIMHFGSDFRNLDVRGVDTSLPFVYTLAEQELWKGEYLKGRQEDYFNQKQESSGLGLSRGWINIVTMLQWVKGDIEE